MAFPDGTHVSGSAGTVFPTETANSTEYPVGMVADADGHIRGSLPAWSLVIPPGAAGASKVHFDLFNNEAGKIVRLRKMFTIIPNDTAVTGTVGLRLDAMRSSSVGSGGTVASQTVSASKTAPAFWSFTPGLTLPAGITARAAPTGGATDEAWLFPSYSFPEETNVSTQMSQYYNLLPELISEQPIELPTGKGLKIVQGSVASVGTVAFLICFTIE